MKNNRKSYSESLRSARAALQRDLSDRFGEPVKVQVFADMFDVQDEEWKNAIEGRMGRLKFSLITEPRYAHTAAVIFGDMKQFEDVDLINSRLSWTVNQRPWMVRFMRRWIQRKSM